MSKWARILADALPRRLALLDIGARDGLQHPWNAFSSMIFALLVEPDPEEAGRLRASLQADQGSVLPFALWRENASLSLKLTKSRGCSSVFMPNRVFLDQFPESDRFSVDSEIQIQSVTLDGLAEKGELPTVDFAKIDVQGAELSILQGGCRHLASDLVGLEVEVEFAPMYVGQPLFADVEAFVRDELGLELWDIRKTYWKYRSGLNLGPTKGRLIFGDALFFRPVHAFGAWIEKLSPDAARDKIVMLVFSALAYGYADYAWEVLEARDAQLLLNGTLRASLEEAVQSIGRGFRPLAHGSGRFFEVLNAVARSFKSDHGGWATTGQPLGPRRRGPFWT